MFVDQMSFGEMLVRRSARQPNGFRLKEAAPSRSTSDTSFSSYLKNEPSALDCYIKLECKGLPKQSGLLGPFVSHEEN